eukprot:jgi/Chrzof1/13213/Cz07g24190.t1
MLQVSSTVRSVHMTDQYPKMSTARSAQQDTTRTAARYTKLYKELATECIGKYFGEEQLLTKNKVYENELQIGDQLIKQSSSHPLRSFVAVPKLPPELAAYLDKP